MQPTTLTISRGVTPLRQGRASGSGGNLEHTSPHSTEDRNFNLWLVESADGKPTHTVIRLYKLCFAILYARPVHPQI